MSIWVFSIFIQSHWVGTRWWPRKFTCPGGTFTLNWCIASECYERDSVSNQCFENSSTPSVNDHSQYSFYGSIWVVAECYYSLNYLSRPVFRTYYTVFALSKHLCTVQYTYHGLDRWTSEINLALTNWTICHVIFTFWKKMCFSIILRSFQFPSVFGQAAIILVRSFWAIIFFSLFFRNWKARSF